MDKLVCICFMMSQMDILEDYIKFSGQVLAGTACGSCLNLVEKIKREINVEQESKKILDNKQIETKQ